MSTEPEQSNETVSQILAAVKSPMIFNALAVLATVALVWIAFGVDLTRERLEVLGIGFLFVVGVTFWLNWFAARNPRFLAYGPREYLRESEMAHERKMKGVE